MKRRTAAVTIQIPEPCRQPWDEMTPENGGRYCAACAKTVGDFTRMTDAQILEVMRNSAGGCGRFRADQLNRELVEPPEEKRFSSAPFYKLAAGLLFIFSAGKATAQEKKAAVQQTDSTNRNTEGTSIKIAADTSKFSSETVLTAEDIEKLSVRDVAAQVATTAGGYNSQKGQPLVMGGGRGENTVYIIDGMLQDGSGRRLKKWWQFWKRH